jgi:ribosomal protein S18 acetylase RimI-like enzyme
MRDGPLVQLRFAAAADAHSVAALHAESWQHHYRGAYADDYLDGDVLADRLVLWTRQLSRPAVEHRTIVAQHREDVVGFAHTVLDDDAVYGALLDNLHVAYALKGQGIGTALLSATASAVIDGPCASRGLYLWVLEQNTAAQGFYEARGGKQVGRRRVAPPGGDPARLNGAPEAFRYVWPDPSVLLIE